MGTGSVLLLFLMARQSWYTITDWLIPKLEGFRAHPYWDNKQYSWGYGTRAPGPDGTIDKVQALKDSRAHMLADKQYLESMLTRPLNAHQWAAYLSFAYNEGRYNADNLVRNINAGDDAALEHQWKLYNLSNGSVNDGLVERRNIEWNIWQGQL